MYATTGQGASENGIGIKMIVNGSPMNSKVECAKLAPQRSADGKRDVFFSDSDILRYSVILVVIEGYF